MLVTNYCIAECVHGVRLRDITRSITAANPNGSNRNQYLAVDFHLMKSFNCTRDETSNQKVNGLPRAPHNQVDCDCNNWWRQKMVVALMWDGLFYEISFAFYLFFLPRFSSEIFFFIILRCELITCEILWTFGVDNSNKCHNGFGCSAACKIMLIYERRKSWCAAYMRIPFEKKPEINGVASAIFAATTKNTEPDLMSHTRHAHTYDGMMRIDEQIKSEYHNEISKLLQFNNLRFSNEHIQIPFDGCISFRHFLTPSAFTSFRIRFMYSFFRLSNVH